MATALMYPDPEKRGRGNKINSSKNEELKTVSSGNLSMARFVLRHCREMAEEVLRNPKRPLSVAYEEAQAIVEKQRLAEEERQRQLAANKQRGVYLPDGVTSIRAALELLSAPRARG